ncbi:hypothetical protein ACEUZ9_005421 [Paracoccus litorisediminis]|jgi:hypothetical protein|uniref:Uncharacterized protein n=1 Tax=Paracoccus litorisediminis TaxID=2006130 RepID=A0A844HLC4_9RHOB|nr:hypothetical protein [Paracoccus litorisediminis]
MLVATLLALAGFIGAGRRRNYLGLALKSGYVIAGFSQNHHSPRLRRYVRTQPRQ